MYYWQILSVELLGSSQTFLGTLTTLIILCIFANENNFIYKILDNVVGNFQEEIEKLRVNTNFENVINSSDYKLLTRVVGNEKEDEALKKEGTKLLSKISNLKLNLQFKYAKIEVFGDKQINAIKLSTEQTLAPLYTFGFCIFIFIFDELLRFSSMGFYNLFYSILATFIAFSFIFWLFIWIKFLINIHGESNSLMRKIKESIENFGNKFNKLPHPLVMIIILTILSSLCVCLISYFPIEWRSYALIISITLPFSLLGILKSCIHVTEYSHMFIFKHIFIIIVLAILLCTVLIYCINVNDNWLIPYNPYLFKASVFLFTLFNGLILPFLMPYLCYWSIYKKAQNNEKHSKELAKQKENEIKEELKKFCEKVQP